MKECVMDFYNLNGIIMPAESFDEEILSRGKSLYEVVRVIEGVPLFLERHLSRLQNSAAIEQLSLWLSMEEIKKRMLQVIRENGYVEGNIKIVFNYNLNEKGRTETFLAYYLRHSYPSEELYKKGVPVVLYHGERSNPNAKVINSHFRDKVNEFIGERKAYEAILVDSKGNITEGSRSNIFLVKNHKVYTSPIENVLPGVTRGNIIELCRLNGIIVMEEAIHYTSLTDFEGLFISGTSPKVLPISSVDEIEYASGDNDLIMRVMELYNQSIKKYISIHR